MTSFDGLERRLTARLDERAAPRAPAGLSEAIDERVDGTKQRPAWATTERWISMETRAQLGAVPRAAIVFAILALLTLVVASAIAIGASTTAKLPPPFGPAANGLVAFDHDGDIYVAEPDGSGLRQITSSPELDRDPSWSRDGTRLAYHTEIGDEVRLVVTDAAGDDPVTVATTLSGDLALDPWIEWSADSTEIMYNAVDPEIGSDGCPYSAGDGGRCGSRLYIVPADGSAPAHQVGDPDLDARGPALSPDGETVAFGGGPGGWEALYLMDWDGSNVRELEPIGPTGGWAFAQQSWSADGTRIVTHDDLRGAAQRIWLVEADGSGATQISEGFGSQFWPRFAPDGSAIVWATDSGGMIWTPGDGPVPLNPGVGEWSPDGTRFHALRGGTLFVVDRSGEELAELGPADSGKATGRWQRLAE